MSAVGGRPAPRAGAALGLALGSLAVAALAVAVTTAVWQVRSTFAAPYWDQWSTVADYFAFPAGWAGLRTLLAQNNEHRILVPRLVMYADLRFFGGRNAFNVSAVDAVQLAHLALIGAMGRALLFRSFAGAAVAAFGACAMLSAAQYENIYWGFQSQFVMVYLFAAGAIACAARAGAGPRGSLAGAALCAALASFSMANGLLVWPLLVAGLLRRAPRAAALLAAVAVPVFAVYLHGYVPVASHTPLGEAGLRPAAAAAYLLAFLGALVSPESVPGAQASGAALLVGLAALAARRAASRERLAPAAAFAWGNALFVLGSGLATTLGRFGFGAIQALSPRYVTPGAVLWSAAGLLALDAVRSARGRAGLAAAACGLVVVLAAVNQPVALARMDMHADKMRTATDAMLSGVTEPAVLADLGAPAPAIAEVGALLARGRLSSFAAPEAGWIGRPLGDSFGIVSDPRCLGDIDQVRPLAEDDATGAIVSGWAWDAREGRAPAAVVLVDGGGRVVGFGRGGAPRPDVPAAVPSIGSDRVGWAGFAGPDRAGNLAAYAVSGDGRGACRLRPARRG